MFGLKCVQSKVESREIVSYETTVSFHFQTFIADGKGMEVEDQTLDSTLFYEGMLHFVNQFINIYVSVCYRFPLFTAIHKICIREMDPREFITCLRNHPEHL